jgi:hypothetical protein
MATSFIVVIPVVWLSQALGLSLIMSRRGFHPLPWLAVSLLLGPAMWPLALAEAISGLPSPEVIRHGHRRQAGVDVFVVLHRNEFPEALARQVERVLPHCRRLVFGRVIKAGGPVTVKQEAAWFLRMVAHQLGPGEAELQILYGDMRRVVDAIHEEGDFAIVLRSDLPDELYDDGGQLQKVRYLRDVPPA